MQFRILGPLEVWDGPRPLGLGRPKQRAVLAILLLHANRVVPLDRLIDQLWSGQPPAQATASLQAYIYNLRRLLEPGRAVRAPARVLLSQSPGYRLVVTGEQLDATRFESLAGEGHRLLEAGEQGRAAEVLAEGLGLWRGPVLADFPDAPFTEAERSRLEELRLAALEDRITADLAFGRHAAVVAELEELVAAHPFRERLHGLLMLAMYRAGRQADALRVYQGVRRSLREELGVDPDPWLQQLETDILRQSPALARPLPAGGTGAAVHDPEPQIQPAAAVVQGLLGRGEQLATIAALLAAAAAGGGRVLLVAGEPGIGKTRLAEEAARLVAGGARVGWGRCWEGEGAPALWPWVQIVRELVVGLAPERLEELLGGARGELAQLLPELAGPGSPPPAPVVNLEAARFQLYQAVTGLLRRTAAEQPLLLVLDDLHWADLPSLRLLTFLAGELGGARLLVLATYRSVEAGANPSLGEALATLARQPSVERMVLGGLDQAEVAQLMAAETGTEPDRRLAQLVHERTDGNPFFVVELLRLLASELRSRGADQQAAQTLVTQRIPVGVQDVLRGRLALLPAQTHTVLLVAAVVGRQFELDTVEAVTQLDDEEALEAVEAALVSGLVVEDPTAVGRYGFVHALVREAIYEDISRARRARLHARVGDVLSARYRLDDPEHALEIAHHRWLAAPVTGGAAALPSLIAAADQALERLAYEEAERQLRRGLELLAATPASLERARAELDLHLRLGAVLGQLHGPAAAGTAASFSRALTLAGEVADDPAMLAALRGLHEAATAQGEHGRARRLAERMLAVAERLDHQAFRAASHMTVGRTLYIQGELQQARPHLEHSLELADSAADAVRWPVPLTVTSRILLGATLELENDEVVRNLKGMDELDFKGWNNADWNGVFAHYHTDDVLVEVNGQRPTHGIQEHTAAMRAFVESTGGTPTQVKSHPIAFGSGEWTCVVGELDGGRRMVTVAKWRDGAIAEEYIWM